MTSSFLLRWFALWLSLGFALRLLFLAYYPQGAATPGLYELLVGALHDFLAFWLAPALLSLFVLVRKSWVKIGYLLTNAVILIVLIAEGFFWL